MPKDPTISYGVYHFNLFAFGLGVDSALTVLWSNHDYQDPVPGSALCDTVAP